MVKIFNRALGTIFMIAVVCIITAFDIYGEDEYKVVDDFTNEVIETFDSLSSANYFYNQNVDEYDNLVLYENDTVLRMEYGIVEFQTNDACTLNVGYRSTIRSDTTSINGCYGIDGVYIGQSNNNVYFVYAGDFGYTSFDSLILHPINSLNIRVSLYRNIDGKLTHLIKTQLDSDFYSETNVIDYAPSYLKEDVDYYSYDGHYFYDNFKTMSDDYSNNTYENAINYEEPYYNYYMYLPFRSLSNYSYNEINDYFTNTLKIASKLNYYNDKVNDNANDVVNRSQYYGELDSFFIYQNIYGTNALNTLSISMLDSSSGKNYKAYSKNDVFLNNAYDNDEERNKDAYNSISNSIYTFDKYILSNHNGNSRSSLYAGTYMGDKLSGYNLFNSNDAYYGEKVAANYFKIDSSLGDKDLNSYCLGIIYNLNRLTFYSDESLSSRVTRLYNLYNFSLIILDETDDAYKVQLDFSNSSDYEYDFENLVAYISKDAVDLVVNSDKMHENSFESISYDFDGGSFIGKDTLDVSYLSGVDITMPKPIKNGFEFVGFDENNKAIYKEIKNIEVKEFENTTIELDKPINLKNASIKIKYADSSSKVIPITSDMITNFNNTVSGSQDITITYCGVSVNQTIEVSSELKDIRDNLDYLIAKNIESYKKDGTYDINELNTIVENINKVDYDFSTNSLRDIDNILLNVNRASTNYIVIGNDIDLSVSGLALNELKEVNENSLFKDTYYVHVSSINNSAKETLQEIGLAYGFEVVDYFSVDYSLNMLKSKQNGSLIYSLKPNNMDPNYIYTVYRLDNNGDVVKCKTTWSSDSVSFMTKKDGDFVVLRKRSVNTYDFDSAYENVNYQDNDPDSQQIFLFLVSYSVVILFGILNIVYHYVLENKLKKSSLEYKKLLNIK